jgi:hypothetical protein
VDVESFCAIAIYLAMPVQTELKTGRGETSSIKLKLDIDRNADWNRLSMKLSRLELPLLDGVDCFLR